MSVYSVGLNVDRIDSITRAGIDLSSLDPVPDLEREGAVCVDAIALLRRLDTMRDQLPPDVRDMAHYIDTSITRFENHVALLALAVFAVGFALNWLV